MVRRSAGVLLYREEDRGLEVLLVHPGGPFWKNKDAGAWSIPKGEYPEDEPAEAAARREFREETGISLDIPLAPLGTVRQAGGKQVTAFAGSLPVDPAAIRSEHFSLEWPPRSGRMQDFPEVDRAGWFSLEEAGSKIVAGQRPLLERLVDWLAARPGAAGERG